MKNIIPVLVIIVLAVGVYIYAGKENLNTPLKEDMLSLSADNLKTKQANLNVREIEGLVYMREEEKLARDVYLTLYEKWNLQIFKNIASSEQTHTDAIKTILDEYKVEDPVKNDEIGVFTNENLSNLYKDLVAKGFESVQSALYVGATIEDLDIKDIQERINQTENMDILFVYNNLQRGSRNHLRSFNKQIEKYGGTYSPSYISTQKFEAIVSSDR